MGKAQFGGYRSVSLTRGYGFVLLVAFGTLLSGCPLDNLQGPSTVQVGNVATFTMRLTRGSELYPDTNEPFVVAEVPSDWEFDTASFEGTSMGDPVSGTGSVADFDFSDCTQWPAVRQGYKRIMISAGKYENQGDDYADINISFSVGPGMGSKSVRFWAGANTIHHCDYEPVGMDVAVQGKPIPASSPAGLLVLMIAVLTAGILVLRRTL